MKRALATVALTGGLIVVPATAFAQAPPTTVETSVVTETVQRPVTSQVTDTVKKTVTTAEELSTDDDDDDSKAGLWGLLGLLGLLGLAGLAGRRRRDNDGYSGGGTRVSADTTPRGSTSTKP